MKKLLLLLLCLSYLDTAFAQKPIDTTATYNIGGIKQFVSIRGYDRQKPLLLFITGGPGQTSIGSSDTFTTKLRQHFILVEWDQRNCGKTMQLNPSPKPVTMALCKQDARDIVDTLLQKFHRQKLFVFGWSWGTVLGFDLAKTMPGKLYAYFTVSPVIDQLTSERMLLNEMKEKARKDTNKRAITELDSIKIPFENTEQVYLDRKWMFILINGAKMDEQMLHSYFFDPQAQWMYPLINEAWVQNLKKQLPAVKCPVYFFVGKDDEQTNHNISIQYYNELKAPKKELFIFEKSGHSIPYSEPDLFQQDMLSAAAEVGVND
jgi:pimeloyl-ACP methyl ester carboxylesterase